MSFKSRELPCKLADNQDPKPLIDFGELGMYMLTELGFTDTEQHKHCYIFKRNGSDGKELVVKVDKKINGPRHVRDEVNYECVYFNPLTNEQEKRTFYVGLATSSVGVVINDKYGFDMLFVTLESIELLKYRIKSAVAEYDAKSVRQFVASYLNRLEFKDEGGDKFRNTRHNMTLHVKYPGRGDYQLSLMTPDDDFPTVMFGKRNAASVCDLIKGSVGKFYEPNIMGRVVDEMKDFGFVKQKVDSSPKLVDGKYVWVTTPYVLLYNANYGIKLSVWCVNFSRVRVEYELRGSLHNHIECYHTYDSIIETMKTLMV